MSIEEGVTWLTADFNCTVTDPAYVTEILDRLLVEEPPHFGNGMLYIEQPFPYDLEANRIDVRCGERRKPLFWMRAHTVGASCASVGNWADRCGAQDMQDAHGALLSLCWARRPCMTLWCRTSRIRCSRRSARAPGRDAGTIMA